MAEVYVSRGTLEEKLFCEKKVCLYKLFGIQRWEFWSMTNTFGFLQSFYGKAKKFLSLCPEKRLMKKVFSKNYRFPKSLWLSVKVNGMWWKIFGKVVKIDFNCPEELLKKYLFFEKLFNFTKYSRKGSSIFSAGILNLLPTSLNLIFGEMIFFKEMFSQKQFRTLKRK